MTIGNSHYTGAGTRLDGAVSAGPDPSVDHLLVSNECSLPVVIVISYFFELYLE